MSTRSSTDPTLEHVREVAGQLIKRLRELDQADADAAVQSAELAVAMDEALRQLATTEIWGPKNRLPSGELWRVAAPWLSRGSLQRHAREKPFGYAGDHRMLYRICRDDRQGEGLSWAFDDYFQRQSAPRAVRNRARLVANAIAEMMRNKSNGVVRFVSLGSGPAEEVWLVQQQLPADELRRLHVHLIDLDPRALQFCQDRLAAGPPLGGLSIHRRNLKRLASDPAPLAQSDLIACPGFFDYLDQSEVARMLALMYRHLNVGGQLLAFNFAEHNPSRPYMEWIGNWYLTYRTTEALFEARRQAGLPGEVERIGSEEENVNLFIQLTRS